MFNIYITILSPYCIFHSLHNQISFRVAGNLNKIVYNHSLRNIVIPEHSERFWCIFLCFSYDVNGVSSFVVLILQFYYPGKDS